MSITAAELRAPDATQRLQHCLSQTLRWLYRQQLITGEMPAYRRIRQGETFCYPSPLVSALAFEALACADPRSTSFSRRLYDVLPMAERKPLTCGVVTARWRLRCYVASQEFAAGQWRLYGREASGDAEPATSSIGAAMLWQDQGANVQRGIETADRMFALAGGSAFAQAAALRLKAISSEDVSEQGGRLIDALECGPIERAAVVWMLTDAWRFARDPDDTAWTARLLDESLAVYESACAESRLCAVFVTLTLLKLNYRGDEVEQMLGRMLADSEPPWRWPQEPIYRDLSSPALTAALTVAALAAALDAWRSIS